MKKLFLLILGVILLLSPLNLVMAEETTLHLGITAMRPEALMAQEWQPLTDYLDGQLAGYKIQTHILDHAAMRTALRRGELDFVLTNPSHYIILKKENGLSTPLATLVRQDDFRPLHSFGGVIFTLASRDDIRSLADIKGKKIVSVDTGAGAWGGFQLQVLELNHAGISLDMDRLLTTGLPMDRVIRAVLEGKAEVGFVRTGLIEQLEREGLIPFGSFKVLNQQTLPGYPFVSSTALYPEWPFVSLPHVDERLVARVAATLLQIEPGDLSLAATGIYAFSVPADYLPVENVLRALKLPPFDTALQIGIADVWSRYRLWISALALTLSVGIVVFLRLLVSKRRLTTVLTELEQLQGRLHNSLSAANRAVRLLSASNRTLLRGPSEAEHLRLVCQIAVEVGGHTAAWVGMVRHDEEKSIVPVAWFGFEKDWSERINMSWGGGERSTSAMGMAIHTGTVQVRHDILNDPTMVICHEHARKLGFQTSIALPLRVGGDVIGALSICTRETNAFEGDEVALLEELADDLAFGIQTIRMREKHEKSQEHVRKLAYYDRLTGLPNRFMFLEQLEQRVDSAAGAGQPFGLVRIDLTNVREINETHGHALGDQLIMRASRQIQEICGQAVLVARLSGNDFALICPEENVFSIERIGEKLLAALSSPFFLSGQRLKIGGAMGVVSCPEDGGNSEELLSKVDLATSRAKSADGGICFYRAEMGEHLARTMALATRLEDAIHDNALELFYQAKIDLESGRPTGAEALLRWHDPVLGWVGPAEFIPVAEARGLMTTLGTWVLRRACRDIRQWRDEGIDIPGRIAVNISARQLETPDFLAGINAILEETGVSPESLELELTESILMSDPERINGLLRGLKNRGFSLAMDDFGTGYSSLAYLKRFPLDTLKIDRAFIRDMLEDQNDRAIVSTIVAMAEQFGLTTVAEGVENEEQARILKVLGCYQAQGFHYSRPEPAGKFRNKWLQTGRGDSWGETG